MRAQWSCPDIDPEKVREPGMHLPVDSTHTQFPVCPAAFLRTYGEVELLRDRFKARPFAEHLVGGRVHAGAIVSEVAYEIEAGARNIDSISPKMREGVHIWFREKSERDAADSEMRKAAR